MADIDTVVVNPPHAQITTRCAHPACMRRSAAEVAALLSNKRRCHSCRLPAPLARATFAARGKAGVRIRFIARCATHVNVNPPRHATLHPASEHQQDAP